MYHKDILKEKGNLIYATTISTSAIISFNVMTIYFYLVSIDKLPLVPNKFYMIFFAGIIALANYSIIRTKKFLECNFRTDKKGGYIIVGFAVLSFIILFTFVDFNKSKSQFNKSQTLSIQY